MGPLSERIMRAKRSPKRITITVSGISFERIHELAQIQGRSASNFACYLIETSLASYQPRAMR